MPQVNLQYCAAAQDPNKIFPYAGQREHPQFFSISPSVLVSRSFIDSNKATIYWANLLLQIVIGIILCQSMYCQSVYNNGNTDNIRTSSLLRFDHLSIELGLSQSSGHCILQDKYGFVWIGTQDGVNRYDGYSFTVYRHSPTDTNSLSDSWITNLYEDRNGQLWVMTRNGINLFDAAREQFTRFYIPYATALCSDTNHNVYVATVQGVYHYSGRTKRCEKILNGSVRALGMDSLQRLLVVQKQIILRINRSNSKPDTIWSNHTFSNSLSLQNSPYHSAQSTHRTVAQFHEGLSSSQGFRAIATMPDNTLVILQENKAHWLDPQSGSIKASISLARGNVQDHGNELLYAVLVLSNHSVLLCERNTLVYWDFISGETYHFFAPPLQKSIAGISENINTALIQDSTQVWIGTNLGAWRVFPKERIIHRIERDPTEPQSLNDMQVLSLYIDRFETLWLGTRTGGVNIWNPHRYKFSIHRHNPFKDNSLSDNNVRAFAQDNRGIWIGTNKGLNFFDTVRKTWTRYFPAPNNAHSLSHEHISCIINDGRGVIWCGLRFGGLCALNKKTQRFEQFRAHPSIPNTLSHDHVLAMHYAQHGEAAGKILIATQGGGLNLFDPQHKTFQRYSRTSKVNSGFATDSLRAVFEDSQGRIWIGSSGYGLILFSIAKGLLAQFTSQIGDTASLSNNTVNYIFEDSHRRLWIATASGLNLYNENQQRFQQFSTSKGLPNAYIYGICEDERGNLWLSTNNGLSCFNPNTHTFRNFDAFDGLQSNEFNTGAFFRSSSGMMYFGGIGGFNSFMPSDVLSSPLRHIPIVLIAFKVNGKQRAFAQPLAEIREITLHHDENEISFDFVALDFLGAAKIRYSYWLEGFDKRWSEWGYRRYAAYTNLDPGTYTFRVRANTTGLDDSAESSSILITISAPFWQTLWFRVLMVVLIAGVLFVGVRWRIYSIQRRNEILEQQVQLRTEELIFASEEIQRQNIQLNDHNIAMELAIQELAALNKEKNEFLGIAAHDLKNPLTGIMLSANMLINYRNKLKEDDITDIVKKIYLSAERMFAIITNLLDINAIESGKFNFSSIRISLNTIIQSIFEDYSKRAKDKDIQIIIEYFPADLREVWIIGDTTAVAEVLENLVSNAIKYSPLHKRVWIRLFDSAAPYDIVQAITSLGIPHSHPIPPQCGIVCVQDEGFGIPETEKHKLFGQFVKLSTRPTAGEHSTGLGLSIVKKMVEAMNGKVWCESEEGKGAAFFVALPHAETENS